MFFKSIKEFNSLSELNDSQYVRALEYGFRSTLLGYRFNNLADIIGTMAAISTGMDRSVEAVAHRPTTSLTCSARIHFRCGAQDLFGSQDVSLFP